MLYGWLPNGKHKWYADRKQTTIWQYDKPKKSAEHPTMKPIPLVAYPIKNSSAPNAAVMDLFGGSGSTLMACDQTDRICYTMELDERYASVIVDRYIQFHEGVSQNVKVLRDGAELSYEEAADRLRSQEDHDWNEENTSRIIYSTEPLETMTHQVEEALNQCYH